MTAATRSSLVDLASPLMPADPDRHGVVVEAGEGWSFDVAAVPPDADLAVWARLPDRSSVAATSRRAVGRELTLRALPRSIPAGWRVAGVHTLPPRQLRAPGLRTRVVSAMRRGVLVELTALPDGARVLDAVAGAAGAVGFPTGIHLGGGGALVTRVTMADGRPAVLRVGRSGTAGDPAAAGATLEQLAAAGVVPVPALLSRGCTLGASWLVESTLPGRRPVHLTPALALQVAGVCARFPVAAGPPTALADDLAGIAGHLPAHAGALARLAATHASRLRTCPGVLRHGDLWAGNLLVEHGRLSALLDWDGAHPAAIPGTDLVHLFAIEALSRHGIGLGAAYVSRPWRSDAFRRASGPYWAALDLRPRPELLDLAGIAWWAAAVHGTLSRFPARATDERWLSANVDPVLAEAS